MQGYGAISQPGGNPNVPSAPPVSDSHQGYPPSAYGGQGYGQGYPPTAPGQGYPPTAPGGKGYPPSAPGGYHPTAPGGQGYPPTAPGGKGYPPTAPGGFPPTAPGGQGYPPTAPGGYPPTAPGGQVYPPTAPGGQGYPPTAPGGQGYPPTAPGGKGYPPTAPGGYPPTAPGGQGYPPTAPGGKGYPPTAPGGYPPTAPGGYPPTAPGGQGYPPTAPGGQGYPPTGPGDPVYPPAAMGGQGYPSKEPYPPSGPGGPAGGPMYPPPSGYQSDDQGGTAPPFTPPPAGYLDPIPGYDSITFDDIPLLPPSYDEAVRPKEPKDRKPLSGLPVISEQQARSALLELCSAKCCYGSKAAQQMSIRHMNSTSAFHYTLETFTEKRSTAWAQVPFVGCGTLDTAMNGPAPQPWDIQAFASEKFKTETKKLEVPHTACVKPCHMCHASGYVRCHSCHGHGRSRCSSCGGRGRRTVGNDHRSCTFCNGSGQRHCFSCSGHGRVRCHHCRGCGQLKWFIQLTVTWTNHFEDYILERTAMPDELIRKADGQTAFQEEQPWLYPINHCPEVSVNRASSELIEKHRKAFPNERQLTQRHVIRIVPVTEVQADWKEKTFTFFVYGLEGKVYTADYPQMWCCGCNIL